MGPWSRQSLRLLSDVMLLSDSELVELTRKQRHGAQCRALRAMGIEHRQRPDGSVLVHRSHIDKLLGAVANAKVCNVKRAGINWEK